MQKLKKYRLVQFLRRHTVFITIILLALTATAGVLYWYTDTTNAKITETQKQSAIFTKDMDSKIAVLQAKAAALKKAAEEKARLEAEAKAKEAAELAAKATATSAIAINSSNCNPSTSHNNPASIDVVVNKKHCMQPVGYVPADLVSSRGATLSAKAISSFDALMAAADAAGQSIAITSSYRSYSDQVATYAYWVNTSGAAGADTYSARAGYSEHQTGLAFDVANADRSCVLDCFGSTPQYQWLQQHAASYGFVQRYYAGYDSITGYTSEEWHYRYVGTAVAQDMVAKGIKTLEQYWNVSGGNYF